MVNRTIANASPSGPCEEPATSGRPCTSVVTAVARSVPLTKWVLAPQPVNLVADPLVAEAGDEAVGGLVKLGEEDPILKLTVRRADSSKPPAT